MQRHLQLAFHFFRVKRAGDGQFAERCAGFLKMQRELFDLCRRHVAIQRGTEGVKITERAAGLRHGKIHAAAGRTRVQIRGQRAIEIAFERRREQTAGVVGGIVFDANVGGQIKLRRLAVFQIGQREVDIGQPGEITPAVGVIFNLQKGRVAQRQLA